MSDPIAKLTIRPAVPKDATTILRLIRDLASFETLLDQVRVTEADILRDGFGANPRFECLLAELDRAAVGFALFFHSYSTFQGRAGIYLEDIFVAESARAKGVGRALMARLARLAVDRGCARLDLSVLHWNPARDFYLRLGFQKVSDWLPYRVDGAPLRRLADSDAATKIS